MKALNIAGFALKRMFRDKGMFFGTIIFPIIFMFIMGAAFGNMGGGGSSKIYISLADEDNGQYSKLLVNYLRSNPSISLKTVSSSKVYDDVRNANVEVGYIIPKGFTDAIKNGSKISMQVVKLGENQSATTISTIINSYISNIRAAYVISDTVKNQTGDSTVFDDVFSQTIKKLDNTVAGVRTENVTKGKVKKDAYSPNIGFVIMFIMFSVVYAMGTILKEKKEGTWGRLLSTPTSKAQVLGGHFLGVLAQGYVQMFIFVVLTVFLLNTYWGNSYLLLFIIITAFLLAVMGIGLMLSGFVKTYAQLDALGAIVIVPTSMLSGAYWPVEIMPQFMQKIAHFMPQYWAMNGVISLVKGGGDFASILTPVLVLLGIAVVSFAIGMGLLRYE